MGGSGKWIKSLIGLKKNQTNDPRRVAKEQKMEAMEECIGWNCYGIVERCKRWNLGDSDGSESHSSDSVIAAMAAVVRAPHKDFVVVKQEWLLFRIQAAFGFSGQNLQFRRNRLDECINWEARRALRAIESKKGHTIFQGLTGEKASCCNWDVCEALSECKLELEPDAIRHQVMEMRQKGLLLIAVDPIKQVESGWCTALAQWMK
ncbi:IQ calmodulin-binding motif [Datura stramonium]|uniref:IQ calmodulin-binding motif n=1 Tax=Datura stramonium TaxID=4076 RepID=A0ABS8RJ19_DATST|nr:IQ calmodulin-binding motif [Datura stramonium]